MTVQVKFSFFFTGGQLLCNVVLASATHCHQPATGVCVCVCRPPPVCGKFNIEHHRVFCAFSFCASLEGQNASMAHSMQGR